MIGVACGTETLDKPQQVWVGEVTAEDRCGKKGTGVGGMGQR